jgi:Fe-S-cluster containining protein
MIKQFVPFEACLSCQGCCRFREENSVWSPCLLEEELQELLDQDIPAAYISLDRRLKLVPNPKAEGFICPFFNASGNSCKIYKMHPFECQLYPFLLSMRNGEILLTVDLNCPYVAQKISSAEMKEYIEYLTAYLNSPRQLEMIKDNPQIIQAYEEVKVVSELGPPDGLK